MHSLNCLHRDIKPKNLMLDATGTVKITDLGLACVVIGQTAVAEMGLAAARRNRMCGTPAYLAPEASERDDGSGCAGVYCEPRDVYALGICAMEMVLREPPASSFEHRKEQIARAIRDPTLGALLAAFIERSTRADPAARPTAEELVALIDDEIIPSAAAVATARQKPRAHLCPRPRVVAARPAPTMHRVAARGAWSAGRPAAMAMGSGMGRPRFSRESAMGRPRVAQLRRGNRPIAGGAVAVVRAGYGSVSGSGSGGSSEEERRGGDEKDQAARRERERGAAEVVGEEEEVVVEEQEQQQQQQRSASNSSNPNSGASTSSNPNSPSTGSTGSVTGRLRELEEENEQLRQETAAREAEAYLCEGLSSREHGGVANHHFFGTSSRHVQHRRGGGPYASIFNSTMCIRLFTRGKYCMVGVAEVVVPSAISLVGDLRLRASLAMDVPLAQVSLETSRGVRLNDNAKTLEEVWLCSGDAVYVSLMMASHGGGGGGGGGAVMAATASTSNEAADAAAESGLMFPLTRHYAGFIGYTGVSC